MKPVFLAVGESTYTQAGEKTRGNLAVLNWRYQQKRMFFSLLHGSHVQTFPSSVSYDLVHPMAVPVEILDTVEKG